VKEQVQLDVDALKKDIRIALTEAGSRPVGRVADWIRVACWREGAFDVASSHNSIESSIWRGHAHVLSERSRWNGGRSALLSGRLTQ
jgi:hypothetical protein